MNALLIVANPDGTSLTHFAVEQLRAALSVVEIADLHAEGFDPVFTQADRSAYQTGRNYPADVVVEQERLSRASDLVFVFPVFWWSMPALLKGWVDRVFANGWAFDWEEGRGSRPLLQRFRAHAMVLTAMSAEVWQQHGYDAALRTQFEHGIVDFCGMQRGVMSFVYDSENPAQAQRALSEWVGEVSASILARQDPGR